MSLKPLRASRFSRAALRVSFEFFPPKTPEMEATLWDAIHRLAPMQPHFVSVTYGAGGSTRERTHQTVARLARETGIKPAAHLTCVGATKAEIGEVVTGYKNAGVKAIVALRGDPQAGLGGLYTPHPGGYASTAELVAGIRRIGGFEVYVSAYPEKHPESPTIEADIDVLKAKVDAGATHAITQFFFENDVYFRYLDRVRARGIDIPILPGIVPVQNFRQTASFATKPASTGASGRLTNVRRGWHRRCKRDSVPPATLEPRHDHTFCFDFCHRPANADADRTGCADRHP